MTRADDADSAATKTIERGRKRDPPGKTFFWIRPAA